MPYGQKPPRQKPSRNKNDQKGSGGNAGWWVLGTVVTGVVIIGLVETGIPQAIFNSSSSSSSSDAIETNAVFQTEQGKVKDMASYKLLPNSAKALKGGGYAVSVSFDLDTAQLKKVYPKANADFVKQVSSMPYYLGLLAVNENDDVKAAACDDLNSIAEAAIEDPSTVIGSKSSVTSKQLQAAESAYSGSDNKKIPNVSVYIVQGKTSTGLSCPK